VFLSPSKGERYLFCEAQYQMQVFITNYRDKAIELSGAEFCWGGQLYNTSPLTTSFEFGLYLE
jgi:hypothetical protein